MTAEKVIAARSDVDAIDGTGAAMGRQSGSECLIMPHTCPVSPSRRVVPVQSVVALFTEKR